MGISDSTLGNYERDQRIPDAEFLARLRDRANVDLNWLVSGQGRPFMVDSDSPLVELRGFVPIPRLEIRASAGNGRVAMVEEAETGIVAFREEWLRRLGVNPKHATIIIAEGDSMADTISHGDLVLIDRSVDRIVDNGIYVLVYDGLVLLKRVQVKRNGVVLLKSDNAAYETEEVDPHELPELIIEGRVRWAGGAI